MAASLDGQARRDAKAVMRVLLPRVPGPIIDFALDSPFARSSMPESLVAAAKGTDLRIETGGAASFTCRKMDSGEFGELSLTPPPFCSPRHLKNNSMVMLHKDTNKLLGLFQLER